MKQKSQHLHFFTPISKQRSLVTMQVKPKHQQWSLYTNSNTFTFLPEHNHLHAPNEGNILFTVHTLRQSQPMFESVDRNASLGMKAFGNRLASRWEWCTPNWSPSVTFAHRHLESLSRFLLLLLKEFSRTLP